MKFQVGDRVLVQHSGEEGDIVDIINNKMVMVDVRGVKFPAYIDQLEFPYFKRFSAPQKKAGDKPQKKFVDEVPKEKTKERPAREAGVRLTIVPVSDTDEFGDEVVEVLKIHLVNGTDTAYRFVYRLTYIGQPGFELTNELEPYQDFYLHDIPFENVNDSPQFAFEFSLRKPQKEKAEYAESILKLKPKQVFTRIQQVRQKGEAHFSYVLLDRYPDRVVEDKIDLGPLNRSGYKIYPADAARHHLEPFRYEVDLHIEKLTDRPASLTNFEKLTLQLKNLDKYLDLAVAHRQPSMIVIHGVGTGKLRDEVHEVLRLRRDVKSFINRYHPAYGHGATEVFFQY